MTAAESLTEHMNEHCEQLRKRAVKGESVMVPLATLLRWQEYAEVIERFAEQRTTAHREAICLRAGIEFILQEDGK